ncbi:MAG: aldo/keto reductase [Proteobacteria bacterium]|nr:aldo/keto reductase [Pseudomonadota bacterium]
MKMNTFGRTGLKVSLLTFGCGAVGGLMTKGDPKDQANAVAWARDHGVNFFDTAASYGNGASETNLGRILGGTSEGIVISTKFGLSAEDLKDAAKSAKASLEASLKRLNLDHVDIFQLHNTPGGPEDDANITLDQVMNDVVPAFEKLRDEGKTRFIGFTAKGNTDDLHRIVESGKFDSAQVFYNLLVPSAGEPVPANYPAQDYRQLLPLCKKHGVGVYGVRVLAGGALSGSEQRHPHGTPTVAPIGSKTDYATDVQRALKFKPLVEAGHAANLPELAIRYVISNPDLPTVEVGIATFEEFKKAYDAIEKGPLPQAVLDEIRTIQKGFAA